MADTLRRLGRWLLTGRYEPPREPVVCDFCAREHHVHDANSGRCITSWCECDHA